MKENFNIYLGTGQIDHGEFKNHGPLIKTMVQLISKSCAQTLWIDTGPEKKLIQLYANIENFLCQQDFYKIKFLKILFLIIMFNTHEGRFVIKSIVKKLYKCWFKPTIGIPIGLSKFVFDKDL